MNERHGSPARVVTDDSSLKGHMPLETTRFPVQYSYLTTRLIIAFHTTKAGSSSGIKTQVTLTTMTRCEFFIDQWKLETLLGPTMLSIAFLTRSECVYEASLFTGVMRLAVGA